MARADHYPKTKTKNIFAEHDRTAKNYKNYVDPKRSNLNYGYGDFDKGKDILQEKMKNRVSEIMGNRQVQDQTHTMGEWVVTYPAELCEVKLYDTGKKTKTGKPVYRKYNSPRDPEECKRFFDEVWRFTAERYGKENMLAGWVHMDETTPQIHMDFVTETVSRKTGNRTVSSASLLTRSELKNYQKDLNMHIQKTLGLQNAILNGRTKGNYTTEELKERQTREKALRRREKALDAREAQIDAEVEKRAQKRAEELVEPTKQLYLRAKKSADDAKNDYLDAELEAEDAAEHLDLLQNTDYAKAFLMARVNQRTGESEWDVFQRDVKKRQEKEKQKYRDDASVRAQRVRGLEDTYADALNVQQDSYGGIEYE